MKNLIKKILKLLGIEELHYINQQEFEITCRSFFPECPFIRGVNGIGEEYSTVMIDDHDMICTLSWDTSGIEFKDWTSGIEFRIDKVEELINFMKMMQGWDAEFLAFEIEEEPEYVEEYHWENPSDWEGFHSSEDK